MTSTMFRIRALASRAAWLKYKAVLTPFARARYERAVAYECRRNATARYTPYWVFEQQTT